MPDLTPAILELVARLSGRPGTSPTVSTPALAEPEPAPGAPAKRPHARTYAFPWPDDLGGLGGRRVVAFDLCADCGAGSWVAYGPRALCLRCARRRAEPAP